MRGFAVLLAVLATQGCYSYVPLPAAAPAPESSRVAIELTARGSADNAERIGVEASRVEGTLLSASSDSLWLALARIRTREGRTMYWSGERMAFDQNTVVRLRERRLSKKKTVLTVLGVAAAMYAASASGLVGFADDNDATDPQGKPPVGGQ
jgi:hypothetical protein